MTFRSEFEHREELLRAALDEFCEHGFDTASINRILSESGMSKGQLYHHFANKEGLYIALVEWMIDQKGTWLAAHPVEGPTDDFFASLSAQIHAAVGFATAHPDVDRLSRALLTERGRPIFEAVTRRFGFGTESPLEALVEHHHAEGAFRDDLPLDFVQRVVTLLMNRAPELLDLEQPDHMAQRIDALLSFMREGLARRS